MDIQVLDPDGAPLTQARLAGTCAWMPSHRHGSKPKQVHELGDGGHELVGQNFGMFGGRLVRMWSDPSGNAEEYAPDGSSGAIYGDACSPTPDAISGMLANIEFPILS